MSRGFRRCPEIPRGVSRCLEIARGCFQVSRSFKSCQEASRNVRHIEVYRCIYMNRCLKVLYDEVFRGVLTCPE